MLTARLSQWHGPFMTLGFIGTVICLERAVALDRTWGYLAPLASHGSTPAGLPAPVQIGLALLLHGQIGMLAIYIPLCAQRGRRHRHPGRRIGMGRPPGCCSPGSR